MTPADNAHLSSLISSTWHVLEQPPPPSLREILGAYRSKGDGDRDMLIAMLNAKSSEDQRMAAIAALHRTLLDVYSTDTKIPPTQPLHHTPLSASSKDKRHTSTSLDPAYKSAPSPRDPPHQPQPPRKRQRYSPSPPPSSHYDPSCSSHLPPRDLPPSPYSSRGDSEEYSPRSRASMAIGSLLSSGAARDPVQDDSQNTPDVAQTRFPSSAIGVSA